MLLIPVLALLRVPRVQQVVRILYLIGHLLLDKLGHRVRDRLRHELKPVLPLRLVRIVKPLVLIEVAINLLDLRNFPTEVLLRLRQAVRSLPGLHFRFPLQGNFPGSTIELLSHSLFRLGIMVTRLVAVVLLPSLSLGRRHYRRLLRKYAPLVVCIHQFRKKHPSGPRILCSIKHIKPTLALSLTLATAALHLAADIKVALLRHGLILKNISHFIFSAFSFILFI